MKKITTKLIPSPKKIAKRGLYEMLWKDAKGKNYKRQDYSKRLKEGRI